MSGCKVRSSRNVGLCLTDRPSTVQTSSRPRRFSLSRNANHARPLCPGQILTRMVGAVEGQGRFDYVTVKFASDGQQRGLAKVEAQRHRERELLLRDRI